MRSTFFRGVVLGSLTAVLVLGASAALAGTGVGGIFNLGKSNTVNAASSLSGSTAAAQLTVANASSSGRGLSVNGASSLAALVAHNSVGQAAAFQTPTSVAPFSVQSTKQVGNLNTSLLGGYAANGLTRVAYSQATNSLADTDGTKTLATVTLTAPSAGFVVVQADVDCEFVSNTIGQLIVRVLDPASSAASWWHDVGLLGASGGGSASAVFPVSAGVNTFDVQGDVFSGTGSTTTYIDATAMFSPFGSTGGSTLMPKHSTAHSQLAQQLHH